MSSSFSLTIFLSDAWLIHVAVLYFLFFLAKAGAKSYFSAQKWIVGGWEGQKTGVDFAYFGLELGMVFEGTTGVYERIYPFNSK